MSAEVLLVRPLSMEITLDTNSVNPSNPRPLSTSPSKLRVSRLLGGLLSLFLFVDAAGKLFRLAPYVEGTAKVGFPPGCLVPMGMVLLVCTALYVVPRTAVLGAVLLTGYFGGAIATHVRMGEPFVFPLVFGVLAWACLYLRDARVRSLVDQPC